MQTGMRNLYHMQASENDNLLRHLEMYCLIRNNIMLQSGRLILLKPKPKNQKSSGEFDATTEGVLKMPAPTTIPIIRTIASINLKVGFGAELVSNIMILVLIGTQVKTLKSKILNIKPTISLISYCLTFLYYSFKNDKERKYI